MRKSLLLGVLVLVACSTQPPYERPAVELPAAWKETAPRYAEGGRWWRIYDDQGLEKIVDEALAGNADLLVAVARVDEARALLGEAQAGFYPQVEARGSASRQQNSKSTATFFGPMPCRCSSSSSVSGYFFNNFWRRL